MIQHELLWECHISNEPTCLAWSPLSTIHSTDKCLQLMVATIHHSIIQLTSDLKSSNVKKVRKYSSLMEFVVHEKF